MGARAITAILGETWAIRPEALENMLAIAGREHEFADGDLTALEQRLGRPLMNTERATVRDGVAIIPISGPLFRYANIMTDLSGATSYATLATDLRAAVDDPAVTAIVLNVDSPGGAVKGANELAKQIRAVRGVKPIVAYVGGDAASAAYWLASAADEIIADESAVLGSIGTMIGLQVAEDKPGVRRYSFVSAQSPLKNADPSTAEGAREIQRLTNEQAQVFVETVASNRGTDTETVLEKYGQGAVYTGAEALKRGMIDSIGTFESVVARFSTGSRPAAFGGMKAGAANMQIKNQAGADVKLPDTMTAGWFAENFPTAADELRKEGTASVDVAKLQAEARAAGAQAEAKRLTDIEALAMPGTDAVVAECKADPECTPEKAAMKILQAARANPAPAAAAAPGAAHLAGLKQTENGLQAPQAGTGSDKEPTLDEAAQAALDLARKAGIDA